MMTYNVKAILEHYKEIFRGKVITRIGDIRCPGNTLVYYHPGEDPAPPPTVRNQMKCTLPMHSCISYLKDVKMYESALGAEWYEYDRDYLGVS